MVGFTCGRRLETPDWHFAGGCLACLWDLLALKVNFAHLVTKPHKKMFLPFSRSLQNLWSAAASGGMCRVDGIFKSRLCINILIN